MLLFYQLTSYVTSAFKVIKNMCFVKILHIFTIFSIPPRLKRILFKSSVFFASLSSLLHVWLQWVLYLQNMFMQSILFCSPSIVILIYMKLSSIKFIWSWSLGSAFGLRCRIRQNTVLRSYLQSLSAIPAIRSKS